MTERSPSARGSKARPSPRRVGQTPPGRVGLAQSRPAEKAAAELQGAAQAYGLQALEALAEIMAGGGSEASRVAAANAILDRGHGKAGQGGRGADAHPKPSTRQVIRWAETDAEALPDPSAATPPQPGRSGRGRAPSTS